MKKEETPLEKSSLIPFVRQNMDILFIALNPAKGSSENGHYFSVNQSFWNQLYASGLITQKVEKSLADVKVFGSVEINFNNWNFGITDLVTEVAESNSRKVKPSIENYLRLQNLIRELKPQTAVLMHGKVLKKFHRSLCLPCPSANSGEMGEILEGSETTFFNIAFPHGNNITNEAKVKRYNDLKAFIISKKEHNAQ